MSHKNIPYTQSSGNVFADLGLSEPEELLRKADLIIDISLTIERRRLSVSEVSALLHLSETEVAELMQEVPHDCSVACLQRYLDTVRGAEAFVPPVPAAARL